MTNDELNAVSVEEVELAFEKIQKLWTVPESGFRKDLILELARIVGFEPVALAGCEVGIKLGLLIADSRARITCH